MTKTQDVGTLDWKTITPLPENKWEPACAVVDGKWYVFGGYTHEGGYPSPFEDMGSSRTSYIFDPEGQTWTRMQDMPSALNHVNIVIDGRKLWYAGGVKDMAIGKSMGGKDHVIAEVWCYDIDLDRFIAAPLLPERRWGGGLALVGRNLHYISGCKEDRDTDAEDHWVFNLDDWANGSAQWTSAAPAPDPRNQGSFVVFHGEIYFISGQYNHDSQQLDQTRTDIYNPESDSWRIGPSVPVPHSHSEGATFVHDDHVYMIGGHDTPEGETKMPTDHVLRLAHGGEWEIIGRLPRPTSSPAARIIDGKLYVAGGFGQNEEDAWKLKTDVWVTDVPK